MDRYANVYVHESIYLSIYPCVHVSMFACMYACRYLSLPCMATGKPIVNGGQFMSIQVKPPQLHLPDNILTCL